MPRYARSLLLRSRSPRRRQLHHARHLQVREQRRARLRSLNACFEWRTRCSISCIAFPLLLAGVDQSFVELENSRPAARSVDGCARGLAFGTHAFQIAMLEFDSGDVFTLRNEPQLHLGLEPGIVLPIRVELPGEHETM